MHLVINRKRGLGTGASFEGIGFGWVGLENKGHFDKGKWAGPILACGSPRSLFNDPISSDVKLTLSLKDGLSVCMNVHRQILVAHSRFFADKLLDTRRKMGQQGQLRGLIDNSSPYIVEIADWYDIEVYIESIRLMYYKDLRRKLMEM
ncbi:hypothetical protein QVD17_39653 [Tagetes erecta]|uniref:BTB domain-containing protein n=1 Tax=Tagetes erecta TaxID=13708 RepID=A0AAD8JQF6_TARER|nr:hypothetical protein QVD17_39653 [Tagetes erecta]